jgi:tetratricopeptide (TPR) repeat protein
MEAFDNEKEIKSLTQAAYDLFYPFLAAEHGKKSSAQALNSYNQARELMELALLVDPKCPGTLNYLGLLHHKLGHEREALHYYKAVLEQQPDRTDTRQAAIILLRHKRDFHEAFKLAEAGTELSPRDSTLWLAHAECAMTISQYHTALSSCDKALETAEQGISPEHINDIKRVKLVAEEKIRNAALPRYEFTHFD